MDIRNRLRKFLFESKTNKAVGILILAKDTNKVLLLKRCCEPHSGTWALLSGGIDDGETKSDALKREVMEEIKIDLDDKIETKYIGEESGECIFYYYEGYTDTEFKPKTNHENTAWGWFSVDELPSPMYPNVTGKIKKACEKQKKN